LDGLTEEQSILNVGFLDKWEELGGEFLNAYPRAQEVKWETEKMKTPYQDTRDYKSEGVTALHFYQFFQPWSEHNLRFNPIWKKYNEQF